MLFISLFGKEKNLNKLCSSETGSKLGDQRRRRLNVNPMETFRIAEKVLSGEDRVAASFICFSMCEVLGSAPVRSTFCLRQ